MEKNPKYVWKVRIGSSIFTSKMAADHKVRSVPVLDFSLQGLLVRDGSA